MNPPVARKLFEAQSRPFQLDPLGRLDQDWTCRHCGYNLRGQSAEGVCSECGTPVGRSMMGDLLRFSDPAWVRSLASGMDWILVAMAISTLSSCISLDIFRTTGQQRTAAVLWESLIGLLSLMGYWKLTSPDPGGLENSRLQSARKIVRATALYKLVATSTKTLLMYYFSSLTIVLTITSSIISMIATLAIITFGRLMAVRIPDQNLAHNCKTLMWIVLGPGALFISLVIWISLIGSASLPKGLFTTTGSSVVVFTVPTSKGTVGLPAAPVSVGLTPLGNCAVLFLGFIVMVWGVILFFRFRSAFHEAARLALHSWAARATNPS